MNPFTKASLERLLSQLGNPRSKMYVLPEDGGYVAENGERGIIILDMKDETHRRIYEIAKSYLSVEKRE